MKTLIVGCIVLVSYLLVADETGRRILSQYTMHLAERFSFEVSLSDTDQVFKDAFLAHRSNIVAEGRGMVDQLLDDDQEGARHQRFIIKLSSGQSLLVAHNIDVAPRIPSLKVGDIVEFKGEYEWNNTGGLLEWTYRDPEGRHVSGWIVHDGNRYE